MVKTRCHFGDFKLYWKCIMKKTFFLFRVLLSLLGTSLIMRRLFLSVQENHLRTPPAIPANLNSPVTPQKISLTPAVPILMYHHIQAYPGGQNPSSPSIFVSPENFTAQLDWLAANDFQTVTPAYLTHPEKIDKKPLILTFDDGYRDVYDTAFPLLKKYHFQATFYLIVNNIDKPGFLTQAQILEMQQAGMNFGSHTLSHPNLTTISDQKAAEEIYASKKILEQITGTPVTDFCYPGGAISQAVENIVANSGYTTAVTTVNESNANQVDPLRLNRLFIQNDTRFPDLPALKKI